MRTDMLEQNSTPLRHTKSREAYLESRSLASMAMVAQLEDRKPQGIFTKEPDVCRESRGWKIPAHVSFPPPLRDPQSRKRGREYEHTNTK